MHDDKTEIFISSKMVELAHERALLYDFIPTLGNHVHELHAWVFEKNAPATDKPIRDVYLDILRNSNLYIGLFWNEYGEWTIDEFDRATEWGMERLCFVKDVDADKRDPRLTKFINDNQGVTSGLTMKWYKTDDELLESVKASITLWIQDQLTRRGAISARLIKDEDDLSTAELPRKLIGRDAHLTQIRDYLGDGERVLLQGHGGVGKTALAGTSARDFIDTHKRPVLWLKAGTANHESLMEAFALDADSRRMMASAKGDDKKTLTRQLIKASNAGLIVLDDCWNGRALASILEVIPRSVPVLVTARQRYSLSQHINLHDLLPDDALTLLKYHANLRDDTHDTDCNAICKKLGYLAFAVEIAGKTLKARTWTPAELLSKLDAPYDLAIPNQQHTDDTRQTVAHLIETSLNALASDETKAVFMAFGAFFTPTATVELLTRYFEGTPEVSDEYLAKIRSKYPNVAKLPNEELKLEILKYFILPNHIPDTSSTDKFLTALQDSGLVTRIPATDDTIAYYRVHDLAYAYSASQMTTEDKDHALTACLDYTERYAQPSLENFACLRPELDNFMGASKWALAREKWRQVERFASNLYEGVDAGGGYLYYQGYLLEALTLLQDSAFCAEKRGHKQAQGAHLGNLGLAYSNLGQYQQAIEHYRQALAIQNEIGDKRGQGNQLGNLGIAYHNLGEYQQAIDHYQQALAISREIGDRRNEGNWLGNLGNAYRNLGRYDDAIEHYQQALAIQNEIGDKRGQGNQLGNLGNAYFSLGRYDEAIDHYQQALAISRDIGNKSAIGSILGNLGVAYDDLERYDEAIDHYQQALGISRDIGDRRGEGNRLNNLGVAYENLKDYAQAINYYEQALVIYRALAVAHLIETTERNLERAKRLRDGGAEE